MADMTPETKAAKMPLRFVTVADVHAPTVRELTRTQTVTEFWAEAMRSSGAYPELFPENEDPAEPPS